jgi:hypothetical protein
MPDQLYRRCPDCRESASGSSCPTCGGQRFIPAGVAPNDAADNDSLRWGIGIRPLMMLVAIAALAAYIGVRWVRQQEMARNAEAALAQAAAQSQQAVPRAWHAQATAGHASSPTPAVPTE